MLDGTAEIVEGDGQPGATVIARYDRSQFMGEVGMLTGQRAYLTVVASSPGRVLAVPVGQLRAVMTHEPGLSDLILHTFLLRGSILMRRGAGLTLIGSRFHPDTRRLLETLCAQLAGVHEAGPGRLARRRDNTAGPGCTRQRAADLLIVPGGPLLRNPGSRVIDPAVYGASSRTGQLIPSHPRYVVDHQNQSPPRD